MSREIKYIGMDVHKEAVVIATSVLLASSSTTVAEFIATELSTTSGHAKSVARARSERNAQVLTSGALSSTRTNQPDNVRES